MATATVSAESIRADARRFVADHWDLDLTLREWWSALFDAGLAAPTWPEEFGGRSLSAGLQRIITEEFAAAHVVSPPLLGIGPAMVGPTILRLGTDEQKRKYLPALAKGEDLWCQLWSEPGAGSDLPAIAARALLDGDEYVVNGQKVWNSGADVAQRGILLARTNPDAAKRQGLTYFLFDMDQAGVEVRPLVQMNGHAEFCEVFLTDARVSADDVLGKVDDGWSAARVTMGFERAMVTGRAPRGLVSVASGRKAGWIDQPLRAVVDGHRNSSIGQRRASALPFKELQALARATGRIDDPITRQDLMHYFTLTQLNRWNMQRSRDQARARGGAPGPEAAITKLMNSLLCTTSSEVTFGLLGAGGMLWSRDATEGSDAVTVALAAPGTRIGGGTDEIQRNQIGEQVLGLPREPVME